MAVKIEGIVGLTPEQIHADVDHGGKFVVFPYCVSLLVITFRRNSPIYFVRPGESAAGKGLPWILLSLVAGWWGIPWGLIYTPIVLFTSLRGGKDVTRQLLPYLAPSSPAAPTPQPGTWPPPPNFTIPE